MIQEEDHIMPGLIIRGEEVLVEGLEISNFRDDERLNAAPNDGRRRKTRWVRSIVLHTTKGIPGGRKTGVPQFVIPGKGDDEKRELRIADMWSTDGRSAGAHLIIDTDGSVGCMGDLANWAAYHAGGKMNEFSIGIEIYQESTGGIYQESLDSAVLLCEAICRAFRIQRQFHAPYLGRPVQRLRRGGADCVGVFGHRDITSRRGSGDPGDIIFEMLRDAGFEDFDFDVGEDMEVWRNRQDELGVLGDGVPGPQTIKAITERRDFSGIWNLRDPGGASMKSEDSGMCMMPVCETCPYRDIGGLV